ncbi:L-galactose dehydrogenase [Amaranthus tricolor]|uniref:L-galactose dehydrogenase n=1 Tax=Amaranthus tricolor TaxID=29722 RepID=UPI00259046BE|nr:L-galactose dehydrogenase [Amaranthus tricolor]
MPLVQISNSQLIIPRNSTITTISASNILHHIHPQIFSQKIRITAMKTNQKLERRELGNTGLKLSCVGFGASPLGKVFGDVSEEQAIATVTNAFNLGINFFDTSPYYGATLSERVLGKCLKALGAPRDQYIVATKCGRYAEGFDFSAERVTRSIDESLERLQLDYVDILQCHDIEFGSLDQIVNETIPTLQKIKESGKARFIGITGLPLDIYTYVLDRVPQGTIDVVLSYCHYCINDSTLEDLLPYLKSKGVGVINASPLSMGLHTENGPPEWHPASPEIKAACKAAADYCKKNGKNISKLALQYSLLNKDISTVLVGMNSVRQVEENVAAALELEAVGKDEKSFAEVENILKPIKNQTWPSGIQKT